MDYVDFGNFLNERMRERGLTAKRLSEISGISLKHLESLLRANMENLPPVPYVRGYIMKLGQVLDFESQRWWESLGKEELIKVSGNKDRLPENRFAKAPSRRYLWLLAAALIILIYFGYNFYKIIGRPVINVSAPAQNPAVVKQSYATIAGQLTNGDYLSINGEQIGFDKNGYFEKNINLQQGINTVEIDAKKFLGGESKVIRQLIYEQPAVSSIPAAQHASSSPTAASSTTGF